MSPLERLGIALPIIQAPMAGTSTPALAAVFCGLRLKAAIFDESSPFNATLEELAKDRERLLP